MDKTEYPLDELPTKALPRQHDIPTEWHPKPHFRQAEIDALPVPISMGGIGNQWLMGDQGR